MTHGADRHREIFDAAMEGGARAMDELRKGGAVAAVGLGVNECAVCIEAMEHFDFDCFLLAGRYTLLEQGALDTLLPACVERGVSLIVGGPFNSGVLAEKEGTPVHFDYTAASAAVVAKVSQIRAVCAAHGVPLAAAALQFPVLHPAVACVIPGARNESEVIANVRNMACEIPAGLWRDLVAEGLLRPDAPVGGPT
jgi:D-threo-aldose 1-dehydrogenase